MSTNRFLSSINCSSSRQFRRVGFQTIPHVCLPRLSDFRERLLDKFHGTVTVKVDGSISINSRGIRGTNLRSADDAGSEYSEHAKLSGCHQWICECKRASNSMETVHSNWSVSHFLLLVLAFISFQCFSSSWLVSILPSTLSESAVLFIYGLRLYFVFWLISWSTEETVL